MRRAAKRRIMTTRPATVVIPRESGRGDHPRIAYVFDGRLANDFMHPRSGARHVTCTSSTMPVEYELPSDPMKVDLDAPPDDPCLAKVVQKCHNAFGSEPNVPDTEYDVPERNRAPADAWFLQPNPHASTLSKESKLALKMACDDSGNLWIVENGIDKGAAQFSRIKHMWKYEGGVTEEDLQWLKTKGFPEESLPWCVTDMKNLTEAPKMLYQKLQSAAVNCWNGGVPDKRWRSIATVPEGL